MLRFKLPLKPDGDDEGTPENATRKNAPEKGVLALPGMAFLPNGKKTVHVMASFSLLNEMDADEALRRLKMAILEARKASIVRRWTY